MKLIHATMTEAYLHPRDETSKQYAKMPQSVEGRHEKKEADNVTISNTLHPEPITICNINHLTFK